MNRTGTRKELLVLAQDLLQRRGASGFSFQDLADQLKVRKASIHYHFGSKQELLEALCDEYLSTFRAWQTKVAGLSVRDRWRRYGLIFRAFLKDGQKICPVSALGVEAASLPAAVRVRVREFQDEHARWVEALVREGQADGSFRKNKSSTAKTTALLISSSMQGALLIARLQNRPAIWDRVFAQLGQNLTHGSGSAV